MKLTIIFMKKNAKVGWNLYEIRISSMKVATYKKIHMANPSQVANYAT